MPIISKCKSILVRLLLFTGLCFLVWAYGFPLLVDIAAFGFLGICAALVENRKTACLLASLVLATTLIEATSRMLTRTQVLSSPYCRPNEKYIRNTKYEPNVDVYFPVPHGDLVAMDPSVSSLIEQPRVIRFKTDSLGYRNNADYYRESLIISGDSFIVANGTDQNDMLTNVLADQYGIHAYSIGFPNDPEHYFGRIERFLKEVNSAVSAIVFVFEGNDFKGSARPLPKPHDYDRWKLRFAKAVEPAFRTSWRVFNATRQIERLVSPQDSQRIEVYQVGRHYVGFYGNYVDMALSPHLDLKETQTDSAVMQTIRAIIFIPTKYRVYYDMLGEKRGRQMVSPPPGYVTLKKRFGEHGIPVVDLTGPLRARARRLLEEGEYVFWRDDTHWNGSGIRVAAAKVAALVALVANREQPG